MKLPASLLATMALAGCGPKMYASETTPRQVQVIEIEEGTQPIEPTEIEPVEVRHFAQPPGTPPPQPVHVVDDCPGCGMG